MLLKEAGAKLIKNLMKHAHSNIRAKKRKCGYLQDTGTRNDLFIIRMLAESRTNAESLILIYRILHRTFDRLSHENRREDISKASLRRRKKHSCNE